MKKSKRWRNPSQLSTEYKSGRWATAPPPSPAAAGPCTAPATARTSSAASRRRCPAALRPGAPPNPPEQPARGPEAGGLPPRDDHHHPPRRGRRRLFPLFFCVEIAQIVDDVGVRVQPLVVAAGHVATHGSVVRRTALGLIYWRL